MVLASQNIEDFLLPNIREMTKPLFSIPTHQFLFNPGQINPKDYMDLADRANKDGICWPSIPTIAKDLKLSESTTRRAIRDLRKAGVIQTEQRYRGNGSNSSLLYKLN